MPQITIGTASWTDKSLIGCKRFYPRGCSSAEDRLRFYAAQFPVVEVDSSYYAMPSATNSRLWVERTPASFVFNIKAFRLFTGHQTGPASLPRDIAEALGPPPEGRKNFYYADIPDEIRDELWDRYREAIAPLRDGGKLIFTVPFEHEGEPVEHFPELHDWTLAEHAGRWTLTNVTRDGVTQTFDDLVFHGGPGSTLEMRVFSRSSVARAFLDAGFARVRYADDTWLPFGIHWPEPWSVPIVAYA
mgnify:CR=1 FL=1